MGMKQKRCPRCKKKRRYDPDARFRPNPKKPERWTLHEGVWVCWYCTQRLPKDGLNWKPYLRDRLIAHHPEGFVIIKPATMARPIPLACPVCNHLLRTSDDEAHYLRFECCNRCADRWAYPHQDRWSRGWRPSDEEVADDVSTRRPLTVRFVVD